MRLCFARILGQYNAGRVPLLQPKPPPSGPNFRFPMLQNFQRYFRFYLAFFLMGILFVGVSWQRLSVSDSQAASMPAAGQPAAAHGAVATR